MQEIGITLPAYQEGALDETLTDEMNTLVCQLKVSKNASVESCSHTTSFKPSFALGALANGHRLYPMTRSSTHRNVAVLTSSGEGGDALDAAEATAREGRGLARGPARAKAAESPL